MIKNMGLKIRMLLAGSLLFGLYAVVALVLMNTYNISLLPIVGLTGIFIVFQYWISQKMILYSVSAEELPKDLSWIDNFAEGYCRDKNMKKPDLYLADLGMPNAFAFGRKNKGTVVVSRELVDKLEREEVKGVVAHELAHIENRDSIIMLLGQSISTIVGFAVILLVSRSREGGFIAAYFASQVAQLLVYVIIMAVSRYREYIADETAAQYMGTGEPLARALEKISSSTSKSSGELKTEASALCIINPGELLSTHPSTKKRIAKLRSY